MKDKKPVIPAMKDKKPVIPAKAGIQKTSVIHYEGQKTCHSREGIQKTSVIHYEVQKNLSFPL